MWAEDLAVITVRTSLDELRDLRAFTHGFNRKELTPDELLPDIWHGLPEIGIDSPYKPPSHNEPLPT